MTSRVATVTVSGAEVSSFYLGDGSTFSGGTVLGPLFQSVSVGTENTLAFNVEFNPDLLRCRRCRMAWP